MIYFDYAATSFPKPESVYLAHEAYFRNAGNPGRGAHCLALASARSIFEARSTVADFLGIQNAERLIFTPSCTYSLNMVLKGIGLEPGDCVIAGALEHNAVMRPLNELQQKSHVQVELMPYAKNGIVDPDELEVQIKAKQPKLCVFAEASNVTGERIPLQQIADVCHRHAVPLLLDAAQTAGSEADCLRHPGVTYWAAPGHKGLMGAPGVGLLYVRDRHDLACLVQGGTGSRSESFAMPPDYPDHLEPGTLAGPAIAALGAGVEFIHKTGAASISAHEQSLATQFREWCLNQSWISIFGASFQNRSQACDAANVPIVSFRLHNLGADRVADILNSDFSIAVRPGLHCAAQAHVSLCTGDTGLVRVSFGFFNTTDELNQLCDALTSIKEGCLPTPRP